MANERVVSWKAIANFAQVSREAERTERSLKNLQKTQKEFNASQGGGANRNASTAGLNKIEANSLDILGKAQARYAKAKSIANKANSESVKTPNENLAGRIAGYEGLASALKEVARQRKALNRANLEATKIDGASTSHVVRDTYDLEKLAKAKRDAAEATKVSNAAAREEKKLSGVSIRVPKAAKPAGPGTAGESNVDLVMRVRATKTLQTATNGLSGASDRLKSAQEGAAVAAARLLATQEKDNATFPQLLAAQTSYERALRRVSIARAADAKEAEKLNSISLPYTEGLAASKRAADALTPSLGNLSRETRNVNRDITRTAGGAGGAGRGFRSLRNDASGAGGGVNILKTALGELHPKWRQNELSAYRFGTVLRASLVPLVITGFNLLASLLSPLAAGFVGLAGAIAPVAGLLATLPGLLFGAAGGIGTLIAGFAGIGGALKAYGTQQKNASKTALQGAKASRTQGKAVADHADTVARSSRAIKSAEQNVADAQRNVTLARKQAREEMDRMQKSLRDLALQEESESLSLEEARARLQQVNDDPGSTDLQRRQANLAVRQAEASLADVKDQQETATKDADEAVRKGVDGSEQVIQAKRAQADAEDALTEAKRSAAKAQRGLDYAVGSGAFPAGAAGVDLYAEAMAKLTPEAQAVVRQLIKMKPLVDALRATAQKGLMPGVLSFLISAEKLFKPVNAFVATAAKSFGDFFDSVGKALTTESALDAWGKILGSTNKIIDMFLESAFNLGVTIGNIAVAARPLTEWLVGSVRDWTKSWRAMSSGEEGQKRLTDFFKKTRSTAAQLGRIIRNLAKTFYGLGRGAQGTGKWMLNAFEKMTKKWSKFTSSVAGQDAIEKWAKEAQPALSQVAGLIGDVIKAVIDLGNDTDIAGIIKQIRDQLLPAVVRVFKLFTGETAAHIVSILSNIGDAIATIAGVDTGGIEGFFGTLDTITGAIDNLVKNVPLAKEAIGLLIAVMATKAALSFASSLLGVSGSIKAIGGTVKTVKKIRSAATAEGKAGAQGAKRAKPSEKETKKQAKEVAKDNAAQAKAAEKAGAKRGAPPTVVPGTKRGAGPAAKGAAKAIPKRAAGAVAGGADDAGKVGKLAGALTKVTKAGGAVQIIFAVGRALAALGPVGAIVGVVALALGTLATGAYLYVNSLKKSMAEHKAAWDAIFAVFRAVGSIVTTVFGFIGRVVSFFFRNFIQLISINFQIIRNLVFVAMDILQLTFIRPFAFIIGAVIAFFRMLYKQFRESLTAIRNIWNALVDLLREPVRRAFKRVADIMTAARTVLGGIIKSIVQAIIDRFNLQPTIDRVVKFNDMVIQQFHDMVDGIKAIVDKIRPIFDKAFAAIRKVVADPIGVVIGIINKGIIGPYKSLAKTFGIDTNVQEIDYKVPTFQSGGTIPGVQSNVKRDNVLGVTSKGKAIARVEPGEFIMPRNKRKFFPMLEAIRRGKISEGGLEKRQHGGMLPGYASGGTVSYKGKTFTPKFVNSIKNAEKRAGFTFNFFQGGFRPATSYSGTSHQKDALDVGPINNTAVKALRASGIAAWDRTGKGNWAPHIHGVPLPGYGTAGGSAIWQAQDYLKGGDGLGGKDNGPRTGILKGLISMLPNPKEVLSKAWDSISGTLNSIKDSEFGRIVANVPKMLFEGLIANAKSIFKEDNVESDNKTGDDPATTMTSADRGKGGFKAAYARGTNSAMQGRILVGENGPEIIQARGGERIINNNLTSRLPGYNKGGIVRGMSEGAKGDWVKGLRSEVHYNTLSSTWTTGLTATLKKLLGSIGTTSYNSYNKTPDFVNSIVNYIKKQKKNKTIDQIAEALKTDSTTVWQNSKAVQDALKKTKASKGDQEYFKKTSTQFGSARTKWLKAYQEKIGESQDGTWSEDSDEPAQHMLYHAFNMPHDDYLAHPWQTTTAAESAIMEQRRANKLNAEFDGYVNIFKDWALDSLVRKMGELGPADGLTLAKSLSKDKNQATVYNKDLETAYSRSDSATDTSSQNAKISLLVSTINAGNGTIGLQGAAQALSLSLDSTAGVYDLAVSQGKLPRSSKTARLDKDVIDFRKLFKFAGGGGVPGYGSRDTVHALLTPGEFVLRKASVAALQRKFGPEVMSDLNNVDKFAAGGFAGGMNMPSFRGSSVSFTRSSSTDTNNVGGKSVVNNFNTTVNNPTLEDGAVSVQKRVTRVAQLGILG